MLDSVIKQVISYIVSCFDSQSRPSFLFSLTFRTPMTQTTWGLSEGKCLSPTSCQRLFTLTLKPRTTTSTYWRLSKASIWERQCWQGGKSARRPLLWQPAGTLVKSCDRYMITRTISMPRLLTVHDRCYYTNCAYTNLVCYHSDFLYNDDTQCDFLLFLSKEID